MLDVLIVKSGSAISAVQSAEKLTRSPLPSGPTDTILYPVRLNQYRLLRVSIAETVKALRKVKFRMFLNGSPLIRTVLALYRAARDASQ
jgi:hypothetical protein